MASLELNDAPEAPIINGHLEKENATNGHTSDTPAAGTDDIEQYPIYYPHPTDFKLTERPVDEVRTLDVVVIGAGLSGITAGILLPVKVPGINLTILEKNSEVGGTWLENVYPGVRCDIPAHVYQSTFSPNTQWSEEYAQGPEIRQYWQSVARKYDVYSKIRFNTRVLRCEWDADRAKWRLDTESTATNERSSLYFDFLISAIGHFNDWKLPDYPGMDKFKGPIIHSSGWDPTFEYQGKRIATIGNGASGIQLTTEIRKSAAQVFHFARSRTYVSCITPTLCLLNLPSRVVNHKRADTNVILFRWIAGSFSPGSKERQDTPLPISEELKKSFEDPKVYLQWRKELEDSFWRAFADQIADSESSQKLKSNFIELMRKRLGDSSDNLLHKLVPNFPPHCRRLTPGPGYLEALTKPNLDFIQTPIKELTEDGIITTDGIHRSVDAVICSTGANVDFAPPFSIVSGKYDLRCDWRPGGRFGFPYSYLGTAVPFFPNLAFILGPHPAGPSGTVPVAVETQVTYIGRMLRKISSQGIRTMTPSKQAADDFVEYCDAFFPRTNLARNCSSWSNGNRPGARIHGHWPGSAAHVNFIKRDPRWEDFEYTYLRPENRFAYFGNGWTKKETSDSDMTPYLRLPEDNDLRDIHERWWDV